VDQDPIPLHRRIDLISLRPDATRSEVERACREAAARSIMAVCVPGSRVALAAAVLEETSVKVSALIGYPFGNSDADVKRFEIETALESGAQEFDVVLDHGLLKDNNDRVVLRHLRDLREAAEERPIKTILELALLTQEEATRAAALIQEAELQFLVTATGCALRPTTPADILRLREALGPDLGLKAVGAINTTAEAEALVTAGANRIGVFQLTPILEG
jgi:deoxyribose-phosphate aldolase